MQRRDVGGRQFFGCTADCTACIAFGRLNRQNFARRRSLLVAVDHGVRRQGCAFAQVPLDFESATGFDSTPISVGNHCHTIRNLNHINHARHGLGCIAVDTGYFAANNGRLFQAGVNHAWEANVDTEFSSAVDFGRHVCTRDTLADNAEVFGCLDRGLLRHWLLRCSFSHLAVSGFFAARTGQHAVGCFDSAGRNSPLSSSAGNQHLTYLSTSDTQFFPAFTNGGRSTCDHGAEESVGVNRSGRSSGNSDFGHVNIQLFCNQHGHRGVNTLAHF